MFISFTATLLGSQLVVAIADEMPHLDSQALCRDASLFNSCLKEEQDAREKLAKIWAQVSPTGQTQCTQTAQIGGPASYVKLLFCVEEARKPLKEK